VLLIELDFYNADSQLLGPRVKPKFVAPVLLCTIPFLRYDTQELVC